MFHLPIAIVVAAAALSCAPARAGESLVISDYDAIVITHQYADGEAGSTEVHRIHFVRNGRVIADRAIVEGMLLGRRPGRFSLTWNDYGCCNRVVYAPQLLELVIAEAPDSDSAEAGPWWGMARRMTDLEAPAEDD